MLSDATHPAVCAQLEAVRAAVRRRGASLLVVFVCDSAHAPLPEDKLAGLCRRGALDARFIVPLVVSSDGVQAAGLRRLALMLQETAAGFYRVEGARAAAKLGPRLVVSEASARAAFKVRPLPVVRRLGCRVVHLKYRKLAGRRVRRVPPGLGHGAAVLPRCVHGHDGVTRTGAAARDVSSALPWLV